MEFFEQGATYLRSLTLAHQNAWHVMSNRAYFGNVLTLAAVDELSRVASDETLAEGYKGPTPQDSSINPRELAFKAEEFASRCRMFMQKHGRASDPMPSGGPYRGDFGQLTRDSEEFWGHLTKALAKWEAVKSK